MKTLICTLGLALAAPVALAQDAPREIPAELSSLIPENASGLVYISPLNLLESRAQGLAQIIAPEMAEMVSLDTLFAQGAPPGLDTSILDRTRPIVVAIGPIAGADMSQSPAICVMFPTSDAGALIAMATPPSARISGGYVGFCTEDTYPIAGNADELFARLPNGLVSAYFNAEPLLKAVGPMANMGIMMGHGMFLGELEKDDEIPDDILDMAADSSDAIVQFLQDAVASIGSAEIGFDLNGTMVDLDFAVNFKEGSPLTKLDCGSGPAFTDLTKFLDLNAANSSIVGMDLSSLATWSRPFVERIFDAIPVPPADAFGDDLGPFDSPEEIFQVAREMAGDYLDIMANFGNGSTSNAYFTDGTSSSAMWLNGVERQQLSDSLMVMAQADLLSFVGVKAERTAVTSASEEITLSLDYDTLGRNFDLSADDLLEVHDGLNEVMGDQFDLSLTSVGDHTLMLFNGGKDGVVNALRTTKANPGNASAELTLAASKIGSAYPFTYTRINVGATAKGYIDMLSKMDEGLGLPPQMVNDIAQLDLPISVHMGIDQTRIFDGIHIDLHDGARLIRLIQQATEVVYSPYGSDPTPFGAKAGHRHPEPELK